MSEEFTPISTQEEFDARIKERLARERESAAKRYEGYVSKADHEKALGEYQRQLDELNTKYAGTDKTITTLQGKIKEYETASVKSRVEHDIGLPYGIAARIRGESEEEIRKDAEALKELIGTREAKAPAAAAEAPADTKGNAAYRQLLSKLKKEEN